MLTKPVTRKARRALAVAAVSGAAWATPVPAQVTAGPDNPPPLPADLPGATPAPGDGAGRGEGAAAGRDSVNGAAAQDGAHATSAGAPSAAAAAGSAVPVKATPAGATEAEAPGSASAEAPSGGQAPTDAADADATDSGATGMSAGTAPGADGVDAASAGAADEVHAGHANPAGAGSAADGTGAMVLKEKRSFDDYERPSGLAWSLFLGVEGGYGVSTAVREVQESEKKGHQFAVRVTPVVSTGAIDLNVSLGYLISQLKASGKDKETLEDKGSPAKQIRGTSIETRIGFASFNPMVALPGPWAIGPVGMILFGTDATFAAKSAKSEKTAFGGVNVQWRHDDAKWPQRYGFQWLVDANIDQRRVQMLNLSAEVGWPIKRRKTIVQAESWEARRQVVDSRQVEKPVDVVSVKEDIAFAIGAQYVNFVTASAELTPLSKRRLTRLGQYLAQNPGLWMGLGIEGHTDKRGTAAYNQKLSDARARSVADALIAAGAPAERIRTQGFGFSRPLDPGNTPVALARNRRVEFRFDGVRDEGQLQSQLFRALRAE